MTYLFTSESVSEGHPDKIADQISDAILDKILSEDPKARVACETVVTTGLAIVCGEITTTAYVDIQKVVRETILNIGYNKSDYFFDGKSCGIMLSLNKQSPDIAIGVNQKKEKQGAGDQGMMFGFATQETEEYLPMSLAFSHRLVKKLAEVRKEQPELMPYLRPDSKSQVTIEYDENHKALRIDAIVISTQHDEFDDNDNMLEKIIEDVKKHIIKKVIPTELLDEKTKYYINPTKRFIIGGPHGDVGLTGRKIIVDTYGGWGAHGGGAFSGKDPSKVDRSAAYALRYIAKNLVAAGVAEQVLVQTSYAIGVAQPLSIYVNTYNTSKIPLKDIEIAKKLLHTFDLSPAGIIKKFELQNPIYTPTAAYGHMGREVYEKEISIQGNLKNITFFPWEKLDAVEKIRTLFNISQ